MPLAHSKATSSLSDFLLLIPTDRAAFSYQGLNLTLAVVFLGKRLSINGRLSFEAGASTPSFFNNSLLPKPDAIFAVTYNQPVGRTK